MSACVKMVTIVLQHQILYVYCVMEQIQILWVIIKEDVYANQKILLILMIIDVILVFTLMIFLSSMMENASALPIILMILTLKILVICANLAVPSIIIQLLMAMGVVFVNKAM